jgi:alkylation response protein AidB-like acyl-CoA dehydrogenase
MRFAFSPEQLALRDAARELFSRECPPSAVRAAWTSRPGGLDRRPWERLADMGALHVLVPEADGGLGLDFCSLVLVLEESGAAAFPYPMVETAAVAAPLLGPRLGAQLVGCCLGGELVACAEDLDLTVVDDSGALRLAGRGEVRFRPVEAVDGARRLGVVDGIADGAEALSSGPEAVEEAFDRLALGTAAQLLGLAQGMLDMTTEHVKTRQQFGVPVGSFQAVKHQLADALMELSFARPAVYYAAYSVAHDLPTRSEDVSTAKAMASEAAMYVGRRALQCHGAIGYTVEYDLHLFLKRAWALARAHGAPAWHRSRVGRSLGLDPAPSGG